ncbi:hypothetical protein XENTR_v10001466 [Xenopus tropicalis]|nr:hypothetical protein XENTR_v10001466 [Xenopus tropicalis]
MKKRIRTPSDRLWISKCAPESCVSLLSSAVKVMPLTYLLMASLSYLWCHMHEMLGTELCRSFVPRTREQTVLGNWGDWGMVVRGHAKLALTQKIESMKQ